VRASQCGCERGLSVTSEAAGVGRRGGLSATVALVLSLAIVVLSLSGCGESGAAPSADELFRSGSSAAQAPQTTPSSALTGKRSPTAPASVPSVLVKHGNRKGRKVVAIAFQLRAVPGKPGGVDRALLEALATDDATATFFMAGLWAQAHHDVAAQIAHSPRFEIGNGGYSTELLRKLPGSVTRERTQLAQEAIRAATGLTPRVYRDAQVGYDTKSIDAIAGLGLRPVSGDIDLTAVNPQLSTVAMSQLALSVVKPGSIIVLTGDGADSRVQRVLVRLLGGLKRQGYDLVTVSALTK
jgi:peptidoglycan/xylan/chitin deacetylase (PgdA/CDA1 family)